MKRSSFTHISLQKRQKIPDKRLYFDLLPIDLKAYFHKQFLPQELDLLVHYPLFRKDLRFIRDHWEVGRVPHPGLLQKPLNYVSEHCYVKMVKTIHDTWLSAPKILERPYNDFHVPLVIQAASNGHIPIFEWIWKTQEAYDYTMNCFNLCRILYIAAAYDQIELISWISHAVKKTHQIEYFINPNPHHETDNRPTMTVNMQEHMVWTAEGKFEKIDPNIKVVVQKKDKKKTTATDTQIHVVQNQQFHFLTILDWFKENYPAKNPDNYSCCKVEVYRNDTNIQLNV